MVNILDLSGLSKRYGEVAALTGVDLSIGASQYVSLLGPSGSGKTTLLRLIAGFEEPDAGSVTFEGRRIDRVPAHLRRIGFVFQNFALFPHLTVEENVAFGLVNGAQPRDAGVIQRAVRDMIGLVGLAGLEGRGVHQISGGQRQRVALARTLVTEPSLVLLDEPLGALDANLRMRMRGELRAIRERLGVTFLHVTGSETEALAMGDTVVVLDRGRIGQVGGSDDVYNSPASASVARFLNCYNIFQGRVDGDAFVAPHGRFPLDKSRSADGAARDAYAVRFDRIEVRRPAAAPSDDEAGIEASFIASEYTGSTQLSFFELPGGRTVEVEAHLSHRQPAAYEPRALYLLTWRRDQALLLSSDGPGA